MNAPRAPRPRRDRGAQESIGSILLVFELVVVFLAALALWGLGALTAVQALVGGAIVIAVMLVAMRTMGRPVGVALGWAVQIALVLAGLLEPIVGIVGLIFGGVWAYGMIAGGRIDRRNGRR